jgi:hypothetical protein
VIASAEYEVQVRPAPEDSVSGTFCPLDLVAELTYVETTLEILKGFIRQILG